MTAPLESRLRSSFACKTCNKRKIKCDASAIGAPCTPCWKLGNQAVDSCKLVKSQRGKYKRRKSSHHNGSTNSPTVEHNFLGLTAELQERLPTFLTDAIRLPCATTDKDGPPGNGKDHHDKGWNETAPPSQCSSAPLSPKHFNQKAPSIIRNVDKSNKDIDLSNKNASSTGVCHLSEDDNSSSERIWERLLDTDPQLRTSIQEAGQMTYLGESFPVAYFIKQFLQKSSNKSRGVGASGNPTSQLHYEVRPPSASQNFRDLLVQVQTPDGHTLSGGLIQLNYLLQNKCFEVPSMEMLTPLVSAYFEFFHPLYPILDRAGFSRHFLLEKNRTGSLLLLWAVLSIGATHCPDDCNQKAGFHNRLEARNSYFHRAKLLYDAGYEKTSTTIVQTLFLFSFRWVDPADDKSSYHWSGAAISLAMSLGMHRTTAASYMSQTDRVLWRRIWWCIYYRDHQASNNLGRPIRTLENEVDVEHLSENDFESDKPAADTHPCCGHQEPQHVAVALAMVGLGKLIPSIRACRYAAGRQAKASSSEAECDQLLNSWEAQLPDSLKWAAAQDDRWAGALHMSHNNITISLHRPQQFGVTNSKATKAAKRISTLISEVIEGDSLCTLPYHCISAIMSATSISYVDKFHAETENARRFAEQRYNLLLMALKELQNYWPVAAWFLRMCQHIDMKTKDSVESSISAVTTERLSSGIEHMRPEEVIPVTPSGALSWPLITGGIHYDFSQFGLFDDLFPTVLPSSLD